MIKEYSDGIESSFNRIGKIINNLNSFVKDTEDELTVCSMSKVVKDSLGFIKQLNLDNQFDIIFNNQSNSLFLGNEIKLQQVVINLLKNSIDALRETNNNKIEINLLENYDTQNCILEIKDNGPGVNKEDIDKIFEMFYTTKELGEGTGLGLAISQKIIDSHHGELTYDDSGEGACFKIELPLLEIESFSATSRYVSGDAAYEDLKVLVLGDDVNLLKRIFNKFKDRKIVLIMSQHYKRLDEILEFFIVDAILDTKDEIKNATFENYHAVKSLCDDESLAKLDEIITKYEADSE